MTRYQVAIIGSGPGGYITAIRAAQLGFKTVVIEKWPTLGGTCLNIGCIPSKSLLHDTELVSLGVPKDFEKIMKKKNEVVQSLTEGVKSLFKKNKIDVITGLGEIVGPTSVKVSDEIIEAEHIIIATGSEPSKLPFLQIDEKRVVTSEGALKLEKVPENLVVIGGGVIGLELASVWQRLGSKVTIVEMLPDIAATMDSALSRGLLSLLKKQGLEFYLNTKVLGADLLEDKINVQIETDKNETKVLEADAVLVAVGRKAYTQGLGLENVGIKLTPRGNIHVNGNFQTSCPSIYAIGDVIEGPMLAHKASEEGVTLVEKLAGLNPRLNYLSIPQVVYTHPEAASVGFSEAEAKASGLDIITGQCSMKAIGRARCNGYAEGFVKVIGDKKTGKLLGLHILSEAAGEMIHEGVLALNKGATIAEIAESSHAHPTLSEGIKEAALAALGRPLNF